MLRASQRAPGTTQAASPGSHADNRAPINIEGGYSGNQAALRRLSRIAPRVQCRLTVGALHDPLEAEADRFAQEATRSTRSSQVAARPSSLHRNSAAGSFDGSAAPAIVDQVLRTPGQQLDGDVSHRFSSRFGHDFSGVRVHTDERAGRSAQAIHALAYTAGNHVVFAPKQYAPQSQSGTRLLAHELAHVVQQGSAPAARIAREPKPDGQEEDQGDDTEETEVKDKWKGTLVSEIVISKARGRVGFRIPQGMILGTVTTDLAVGSYQIKPVLDKHQWSITGAKSGVRFDLDLSESLADPWTLAYPESLTLTVAAGMAGDPKTFGDMVDPNQPALKDPLWLYEGWGNTGTPKPVSGIDDYETIQIDKASVTPTADQPKPTSPIYRIQYRDKTERTLTYAELTPKMKAQLAPIFQKADEDFTMFTLTTFPMWWSIVSITPLAPIPEGNPRPYIPRRVPLAPAEAEPVTGGGAGKTTTPVDPATANQNKAPDVTPGETNPPAQKPAPPPPGPATLDPSIAKYCRPAEQSTAQRLTTQSEFKGRTFKGVPPPDPGYDWVDDLGNTYDALGDGTKAQYFKIDQFKASIDSHLLKGNTYTVIDATGYTPPQVAQIRAYVDSLPPAQQALIRRIGF